MTVMPGFSDASAQSSAPFGSDLGHAWQILYLDPRLKRDAQIAAFSVLVG